MGAAAFLMAEYLQVPYAEVMVAAIIPAFLFYAALFIQVDLESAKLGILGAAARKPAVDLARCCVRAGISSSRSSVLVGGLLWLQPGGRIRRPGRHRAC